MQRKWTLLCLTTFSGDEGKRKYEIVDTGIPFETRPQKYSGGTETVGGLLIPYVGHFRDWPELLRFLCSARAQVYHLSEVEESE